MIPFLDRIVRAPEFQGHAPKDPQYVLGLKWVVRSRAEQNELGVVEEAIRSCGVADIVLDKIEPGPNELAFWVLTSNPKRAFKKLSELPPIADRMATLQAAYAERSKLNFSLLWPKGRHASLPIGLG